MRRLTDLKALAGDIEEAHSAAHGAAVAAGLEFPREHPVYAHIKTARDALIEAMHAVEAEITAADEDEEGGDE